MIGKALYSVGLGLKSLSHNCASKYAKWQGKLAEPCGGWWVRFGALELLMRTARLASFALPTTLPDHIIGRAELQARSYRSIGVAH
jgi:hypothetical protein